MPIMWKLYSVHQIKVVKCNVSVVLVHVTVDHVYWTAEYKRLPKARNICGLLQALCTYFKIVCSKWITCDYIRICIEGEEISSSSLITMNFVHPVSMAQRITLIHYRAESYSSFNHHKKPFREGSPLSNAKLITPKYPLSNSSVEEVRRFSPSLDY